MKQITEYVIEKANFLVKNHVSKSYFDDSIITPKCEYNDFVMNSTEEFASQPKKDYLKFLKGTDSKSSCSILFTDGIVLHIHRYVNSHYIEWAVLLSKSTKWPSESAWKLSVHNYKDSRFANNPDDLFSIDMYDNESKKTLELNFFKFIYNNRDIIEKTLNTTR